MAQPSEVPIDSSQASASLVSAVDVVRGRLIATTFPLEVPGVGEARLRKQQLVLQIDDYLLPRLRTDEAPLLVVVGGSTGAGKSTLVNSLIGERLTTPGVLRPTTRSPMLIFNPAETPWFRPERILPNLVRVEGLPSPGGSGLGNDGSPRSVRALRLAPFSGMPLGLALLDAPDIDSVEEGNRALAAQLLSAADLWLFVTTAARYADAVPWDLLREAAARHAKVALVINRIDPGAEAVEEDLRQMMNANGLEDAPLFAIAESSLDAEGLIPAVQVAAVASWLTELGESPAARFDIARSTRDGVIVDVSRTVRGLAVAAELQAESAHRLRQVVIGAYANAMESIGRATADGELLRGEVLTRWQDFARASDMMRSLERGVSRARDRIVGFFKGDTASSRPVELALATGLEAVTIDALESARQQVRYTWANDTAGASLLATGAGISEIGGIGTAETRQVVAEQIRLWQGDVLEIVREQGANKRGLARGLSYGVNGLGVALMLVVFGATGGITGLEVGVAGGTALVAQKMLEAVFGDDAVRRLTTEAAQKLTSRLQNLVDADASLALNAVSALEISELRPTELRDAAEQLDQAAATEMLTRAQREGEALSVPSVVLRGAGIIPEVEEAPRPGFWKRVLGGGRS